jgi:hypothetical protein
VNWQHFRAFLWLRWRLFANQHTRGGALNAVLVVIAAVSGVLLALALLVTSFVVGLLVLPETSPIVVLLVWDGVALVFLFSWNIGLMADLQRAEAFSLDKFLHLPVSLSGAFVLNYLSSLVCLTTVAFVPAMVGLSIGMTLGQGPALALQLPAALAFVFMVTALTYQLQSWLASLMANKRRRRLIVVAVTLVLVLMFQLPNLVNIYVQPWKAAAPDPDELVKYTEELDRAWKAKEITFAEYLKRQSDFIREREERGRETLRWWKNTAWIANMALPIGWVAWGAAAAMDGNVLPALLAILAYTAVGVGSLWRAYRTTMRIYTGEFSAAAPVRAGPEPTAASPGEKAGPAVFFEKSIPWLSEQATAIALTVFRSLLRAPEVKMMLLSPIIVVVIFGGFLFRSGSEIPAAVRPLITFGAITTILFTLTQLAGNQFGYDRGGFRIFILSPAPRRDILLGRNLALLPILFGLTAPVVAVVAILLPMRLDHVLALPFQFLSMFLIFCMLANVLSMVAPMPVAVGSMKPLSPKTVPMLLHVLFVSVMPMALSPALLPWGIEAGLEALEWSGGLPICLVLAILECAGIAWLFHHVINLEGKLLQAREQRILEAVVAKAE